MDRKAFIREYSDMWETIHKDTSFIPTLHINSDRRVIAVNDAVFSLIQMEILEKVSDLNKHSAQMKKDMEAVKNLHETLTEELLKIQAKRERKDKLERILPPEWKCKMMDVISDDLG